MSALKWSIAVLVLVVLASTAGGQLTWREIGPEPSIRPAPGAMRVSMDVLVHGQPVRVISHEGRRYLPIPEYGTEYQIRVNNHGPRRIVAMVSVDGLSVFNGQPAAESHPGYIVEPFGRLVIPGWRRDRGTVAAFTFESRERSYAFRRGYPDNIGVIGLVAFEEAGREPRPYLERPQSFPPALREADRGLGGAGTGWGRDIDSWIHYVPFVRSANKRTVAIYYDTIENLRRLGVPVDVHHPVPFPRDPEFCPPPR